MTMACNNDNNSKKCDCHTVSSTTPEKLDVDSLVDRVLHLTSKLESDIYHIVLIKSKLTQISEKLIEANANELSVDLTIVSDIRLLEQKICESGINPVLKYIESCADSFLDSLKNHIN